MEQSGMEQYASKTTGRHTTGSRRSAWRRALLGRNAALAAVAAFGVMGGGLVRGFRAQDALGSMFKPLPPARPFINFTKRGFLLHGKPTFITSGSIHYARVPSALWHDRLLRMKRGGFNTVQTYVFWNFQEPHPGVFDFKGRRNLNRYLQIAKKVGLYATVRAGPYSCAEWDSGGYPVWLRFIPGLKVREDDAAFMNPLRTWFHKLLPIVARNQINRHGSVIMVQLENEDPQGWGAVLPNKYYRDLLGLARRAGIVVPTFFSGQHHGADPAGHSAWHSGTRTSPWYTTEFWVDWYNVYGAMPKSKQRFFRRGVWKIIAFGGNGYNFYMIHGGTNFSHWNDDELQASYDYGAAIGQCGDLRPIYYTFKRANYFARSFQNILENSGDSSSKYQTAFSKLPRGVSVDARSSPAGTILFLNNSNNRRESVHLGHGAVMRLRRREIAPVVRNFQLNSAMKIADAQTRIFGIVHNGPMTTLVVYGGKKDVGRLKLSLARPTRGSNGGFKVRGRTAILPLRYPAGAPKQYLLRDGRQTLRVVAGNFRAADRMWFVNSPVGKVAVEGPHYLTDIAGTKNAMRMVVERRLGSHRSQAILYGPAAAPVTFSAGKQNLPPIRAPRLGRWQMATADAPAGIAFNDHKWLLSKNPRQMGVGGYNGAYAWYRTHVHVDRQGTYMLHFNGMRDLATVFVNGHKQVNMKWRSTIAQVHLRSGQNTIAVFTAQYGRNKLFAYLGPIAHRDTKGLSGPVRLEGKPLESLTVKSWQWHMAPNNKRQALAQLKGHGQKWRAGNTHADIFHGQAGYAWYRARLPRLTGSASGVLSFADVDDNGTVFLNGKKVGHHSGWGQPFEIGLNSGWRDHGVNTVEVLVHNTSGAGGIMGPVKFETYAPVPGLRHTAVTQWRTHGGIGRPVAWHAYDGRAPGVPCFYRTTFQAAPPAKLGNHPILRAGFKGLFGGFMWLNGHNLGRYPDKVMPMGLYLPECWLKKGTNTLMIFDEHGRSPAKVRLVVEKAASRVVLRLKEQRR